MKSKQLAAAIGSVVLGLILLVVVLMNYDGWQTSQVQSVYEDAAHGTGDRGTFVLGVRNDAATALAADGDYVPLTTDAEGKLHMADVTVTDITTGTIQVDDGGNVLSVDDGASSLTVDDGAISLTVDGSVIVSSVTTGTIDVGAVSGTVTVDATGQGDVPVDSELPAAAALADAVSNPTVPKVGAAQLLYNATTVNSNWDRERNNWAEWPFPSLQRTASSWVQLINYNARGAYIVVNITGIGLNQSLTVSAQLYDYDGAGAEASDQQETIWASAALTPTGRHTYLIYPGAGAAAQDVVATVSYPIPRLWNVSATLNNSEPITFSIGVHYIN